MLFETDRKFQLEHPKAFFCEKLLTMFGVLGYSGFILFLVMPNAGLTDEFSVLAKASWYLVYLVTLLLVCFRWRTLLLKLPKIIPLIVMLALIIASISWSIMPEVSIKATISLIFTLFFGLYLATRGPLLSTLRIFGGAWLIMTFLALALIFAVPSFGVDQDIHIGAWKGWMLTKNHFGGNMARANLLFFCLLFLDQRNRKLWMLGLAITMICVIGSTSKTALLSALMPYGLWIVYAISKRSILYAIAMVWAFISIVTLTTYMITNHPEQFVSLIGRDLTFTGRTGIWEQSLHWIQLNKWIGYGYSAFWEAPNGPADHIRYELDFEVAHAHNSWLDIALDTGLIGAAIFASITLWCLLKSAWLATGQHGPILIIMMVQILAVTFSESVLLGYNSYVNVFYYFLISYILIGYKIPYPNINQPLSAPDWAFSTKPANYHA
ncbi:O-antigen ligase family protein [Hirschia litorea]|uniref:O-antigen ligase family protein n=1 Tax=Hirschia litorea TaxID=1199156 RepID=A0ABW2IGE3_9PROT